jgi:hypothetical protein
MKIVITEQQLRKVILSEQSGLGSYFYGLTPGGNYVKGGSEKITKELIESITNIKYNNLESFTWAKENYFTN